MAIRKVVFNVSASGVKPASYQWGGVQYEDNATEVNFVLDAEYFSLINEGGGTVKYRIDFSSALAGYQPSENLIISECAVTRTIPKTITQYGGEFVCNLVITRFFDDDTQEEILTLPVTLFFTAAPRQEGRVISNLSAFEENILMNTEKTKNYSLSAENTLNIIEQKIASGEIKGEKGDKGDKGDQGIQGIQGEKGDAYILTDSDKTDIANIVIANFVNVSEVAQ